MWGGAVCSHWWPVWWKYVALKQTRSGKSFSEVWIQLNIRPSASRQLRPDSTSTAHSSKSLFRLTSMVWSGNVQPRVLFINIFCECGVNMFLYCVWNTACVLLCSAIVLHCHFCVLSLTGVTLPALLSQWSCVLWRNSSSCLTVKCLTIHHLFCIICLWTGCAHLTWPKIQNLKRWPSSLLHFSLTLDCFPTVSQHEPALVAS